MKIYEYIKGENERTTKILGFPVMMQTSDYMTSERHQSFMGGIVTTVKINDSYTDKSKKDIKVFGKSIIKRIEEDSYRRYYLFGKKIKEISLIEEFKKQYFKFIDKKHDDIYILRANSGEIYLLLTYLINVLIKRNGSKNPLLIATQKYHIDMIKMLCPNIPYVYIGKFRLKISDDIFKIDNFRFFLLFSNVHFKQVEMDIKNNELGTHHYFKSILNRLNLTYNDLEMNKAIVNLANEKSMLEKIKQTGLNIDKFVFLAPEAQSCKLYDEDFWCDLVNKLEDKGYDVYVNLVDSQIKLKYTKGFKKADLSYGEAFALAKKSKRIISLRSGFTEFLLQTGVPIDVLYTKFKHRNFFDDMDIYMVMSGFGISKIPNVDMSLIREFNMYEMSPAECTKKILENIL